MNYLQSGIMLLLTSLLFSCNGYDEIEGGETSVSTHKSNATKLEGAWEIIRAEGSMSETNVGTVYAFEGDKLTFGKGTFKNPGKTEITDTTFSFQAGENEYKFMYNYQFNGDTLIVKMQKNKGQVFYMTKE